MTKSLKIIFVLSTLFVISISCYCQTILVKDSASLMPLDYCAVQFYRNDKLVEYTFTDSLGIFDLPMNKKHSKIILNSLGYLPKTIRIENLDSVVYLTPKENTLDQILIKAKKTGIQIKGDTLVVDPEIFKRSDDVNLGDLLKRIPGVEVDGGSVLFQRKSVSNLLLQSKDILKQREMAMEAIKIDDIENVEVIQNYKQARDKYNLAKTDETAINVTLKKGALEKWMVDSELQFGYDKKGAIANNAIKVNDKIGVTSFLRANNLGQTVLSSMEFLGLQSSMRNTFRNYRGQDLLPEDFQIPPNLQKNKDGIISANTDWELNNNGRLKNTIIVSRINQESASVKNRTLFNNNDSLIYEQFDFLKSWYVSSGFNYQKEFKNKRFVEFDLPFRMRLPQENSKELGQINTSSFDNLNARKTNELKLSPTFYYSLKLKDSTLLKINTIGNYNKLVEDLSLQSTGYLFGSTENQIVQHFDSETKGLAGNIYFSKKMKKIAVVLSASQSINNQTFKNKINIDDSPIENNLLNSISRIGSKVILGNRNGLYLETELGYNYLYQNFENAIKQESIYDLSGMLRNEWKKTHFVFIRFNRKIELPDLQYQSKIARIRDAINQERGTGFTNKLVISNTINFTYFNYNLLTKEKIHIIATYSEKLNDFIVFNKLNPFYFTQTYFQTPLNSKSFNLNLAYKKRLKKWILDGTYRFTKIMGSSVSNEMINRYVSNSNVGKIEISTDNEVINGDISFQYSKATYFLSGKLVNNFKVITPSVGVSFKKEKLLVKTKIGYSLNSSQTLTSDIINWDFEATYTLKKGKSEITLTGNNLLNLSPRRIHTNQINNFYFEEEAYNMFPGFLIVGLKYYF